MRDGEGEFEFGSVILTRRLILRHPETPDSEAIAGLAANPRVAENLAAAPGECGGASFALVERERRQEHQRDDVVDQGCRQTVKALRIGQNVGR